MEKIIVTVAERLIPQTSLVDSIPFILTGINHDGHHLHARIRHLRLNVS